VDWPESFGLAMVEAMACGTSVIALNHGAVPEVIAHGHSGFVCRSLAEMVRAVEKAMALDRRECRAHAARAFSVRRMVDQYEAHYRRLAGREPAAPAPPRAAGAAAGG
jgi:glycosyltransferase involved in cell wall biosynthesis